MKYLTILLFSTILLAAKGQVDTAMVNAEVRLAVLLNDLRSVKSFQEKEAANIKFKSELEKTIQLKGAMIYPFSKLSTLGSVYSPDYTLRLFNWNIEQADGSQVYYCLVLHYDDRKKEFNVSELIDNSFMLPPRPEDVLEKDNWYGALYYKIIPFEKGSRTMYALLGWDGYNPGTNRKLIDVMYFAGKSPRLGSPVFRVGKESFKRIFYEHSEKCSMSLKYDDKNERILFDHLSPESPNLEGFYAYYVPDMSYDAFKLKKGRWYLEEDVIAVNGKRAEKLNLRFPDENGELKSKKVKNEWIDPSDSKSPVQGTPHVARKPNEEIDKDGKVVKTKPEKVKKSKDKRDPSKLYPYIDMKKKKKRWFSGGN